MVEKGKSYLGCLKEYEEKVPIIVLGHHIILQFSQNHLLFLFLIKLIRVLMRVGANAPRRPLALALVISSSNSNQLLFPVVL